MLVFVDFEHAEGHGRKHGQRMLAARTTLTYRLEDLAGMHCHLVRYNKVDRQLLDDIGATAIFISGNSTEPELYDRDELAVIHDLLRQTPLPVFGFCGGFQLVSEAMGAELVPLEPLEDGAEDPLMTTTPDGRPFEFGYHPIDLCAESVDHPLLAGLGPQPVFRHAHGLHVPVPPDGFVTLASTAATPVQMAVHRDRPVVGTQFHPEYWTDEHPDGRTLITNFLRWAGIGAS